jgi:hypothetical protein
MVQVQQNLLSTRLQKVSEYGIDEQKGAAPACLLFSGSHYDLLLQDSGTGR